MGQLEPFGINELILSGVMSGLMNSYVTEDQESDALESFKAYFYSAALALFPKRSSRKSRPLSLPELRIFTYGGSSFDTFTSYKYVPRELYMTKTLDDFTI